MSAVLEPAAPAAELAGPAAPAGPAAAARADLFGRGAVYALVSALPLVTAALVSPLLAHLLGPAGLGLMASALAVHQVLVVLSTAGLEQSLVVQRAEDGHDAGARRLVGVGLVLSTATAVLSGLTGPLWAPALGFGGFTPLVLATVLWTAPAAATALVLALLTAQDRLVAFTAASATASVGSQVLGLAAVLLVERSAQAYAWGVVAGQVLAVGVGLVAVRPDLRGVADHRLVRRSVALGLPLMLSGLSVFVLNAGDRLVVQRLLGSAEAGRYQVAYTVGFLSVTLAVLLGQAWAARIADVRDERRRWALISASRDHLLLLFAPVVLGVVLGAPLALRVLAPPSFAPEGLLLVVALVVLSGLPVVTSLATTRALITVRRSRPLAVAAALAAVVNTVLNVVLVPHWGLAGAAASTVVAFWVQAVVQRALLPRAVRLPATPARTWLLVGSATAVALATVALPQDPAWVAARTAAALACLPWLWVALRRAQRAPEPAEDLDDDAQ
ncbi:lipopolysaccharide biosynthesis protein [Streptomyces sp. NP160]|uniref:lipopolysaccharide biosynthesis protein n=1 Tax=Streptomyces sp. NP160 TaxID=2586637 RepID=UPI0015D64A37|nr:lipopolysaccharide biosynthesis protein [Streptomyces sp. NP160]